MVMLLHLLLTASCLAAAEPASRPVEATDPTLDWLMGQATTAPATRSAADADPTPPPVPSPLASRTEADWGYRAGTITLSDGTKVHGPIATTRDKPIRVWDEQDKEFRDIPWNLIQSFEARILWERDQPEWHFKEAGSDIKEFTGKTYPAREMQYVLTLLNGQSVTGGVVAPLYLQTPKGDKTYVLHKRDKGEVGQTLTQLVYVKRVQFDKQPAATQPVPF